jgi:hypothetical protein
MKNDELRIMNKERKPGGGLRLGSAVITETRRAQVRGVAESGNAAIALRAAPGTIVELEPAEAPPTVLVRLLGKRIGYLGVEDSQWACEAIWEVGSSVTAFLESAPGCTDNPEVWITMNRTREAPQAQSARGPRIRAS